MLGLTEQISRYVGARASTQRSNVAGTQRAEMAEDNREAIFATLLRAGRPMSSTQVAEVLHLSREGVIGHLNVLAQRGRIMRSHPEKARSGWVVAGARGRLHEAEPGWLDGGEE